MKKTITIVTVLLAGALLNINAQNKHDKNLVKKEPVKAVHLKLETSPVNVVPVNKTPSNAKANITTKEKAPVTKIKVNAVQQQQPIKATKTKIVSTKK